ncbi:MAG: undecaprenyl-diphosphate phosphatase [archaeon]
MLNEILLALIQAATEFLPISSSGHLALVSNIISQPNLFFFTTLHLASLIAVLIFTRKEIKDLITFKQESKPLWIYIILATIPAALVGYFFNDIIEKAFSSLLFISAAFFFTGIILLLTRLAPNTKRKLTIKSSIIIGIFQVLALFPGVSRSGMTISSGFFQGINREKAAKFSFLLFIPLAVGAFILESGKAYFNLSLVISFIVCLLTSLLFLNLLLKIIVKNKFWLFGFYCFLISIVTLLIHFF